MVMFKSFIRHNAIAHLTGYSVVVTTYMYWEMKTQLCAFLYCTVPFVAVVWKQIHNISEVHLQNLESLGFCYSLFQGGYYWRLQEIVTCLCHS